MQTHMKLVSCLSIKPDVAEKEIPFGFQSVKVIFGNQIKCSLPQEILHGSLSILTHPFFCPATRRKPKLFQTGLWSSPYGPLATSSKGCELQRYQEDAQVSASGAAPTPLLHLRWGRDGTGHCCAGIIHPLIT